MSAYTIELADSSDIPAMIDVYYAAFANDPIMSNFDKHVKPSTRKQALISRHTTLLKNSHLTGAHYYKCVEKASGDIVAFVKWDFPRRLTDVQKEEKRLLEEQLRSIVPPEGVNLSLIQDFYGQKLANKGKWHDSETGYELHLLATLPTHHRRGIASLLLAEGIVLADHDNAPIYVEASPTGLPLYLRHGWEIVDEVAVDMSHHGLPELGVCIEKCLVRPSQELHNRE